MSFSGSSGDIDTLQFSRKEIYLEMKKHLTSELQVIIDNLEKYLSEHSGHPITIPEKMRPTISTLFHSLRTKYNEAGKRDNYFFKKNEAWLNVPVCFPVPGVNATTEHRKTKGRPPAEFDQMSDRSKRRRTEDIRANYTYQELSYAAQMSLRASGNLDASKIVKEVSLSSPSKGKDYMKRAVSSLSEKLDGNEALALIYDTGMSKGGYQQMRNRFKAKGMEIIPPYSAVRAARNSCYPHDDFLSFSESKAEVQLQGLLDHTVDRILLLKQDNIAEMTDVELEHMKFLCKWGFDGTSGQSIYKMKFNDPNISDSSLLFTSLVPLQLTAVNTENKSECILWSNTKPSSTQYCRPLKLEFVKETDETSLKEKSHYETQIQQLKPLERVINARKILVEYELAMTMIDGKVCNAVTGTKSSLRCYLCDATSTKFNDIDEMLKRPVNVDHYKLGLSTLHAWIRCFECCIHIAYQSCTQKWQARKTEDKEVKQKRKLVIQEGFKKELGLLVDMPKQGFGSTNDGNTARRFFENTTTSARITGVDEELIHRFHIILQTISSGEAINIAKFRMYTTETAKYFVEKYPWYKMPTGVHRLLIHGPDIIAAALVPIGKLSEEAQEATNKLIKRNREYHARKCSRVKNMEDVFRRLLATTDPFIASLRQVRQKKVKSLLPEAKALLASTPLATDTDEDSDDHLDGDSDSYEDDDSGGNISDFGDETD